MKTSQWGLCFHLQDTNDRFIPIMWMNRNGLLTTGVKWEEYRQVTSLGCARSLGQLWARIGRRGGGNGSDRIGLFA